MTFTEDRMLRRWRARTCAGIVTITTYDAGPDGLMNRQLIGYTLELDHAEIFRGADIGVAPGKAIDSDEVLSAVIDFLALRLGDTDAGYFSGYTPARLAFADACGEELSLMSNEMLDHTCLPVHDGPAPGEVNTLEDAEAVLAHLSTRAGRLTRELEQLQTHLATADLDPETLAGIADTLDAAATVRVTADWARESLTARHGRIAEAMRATDHPARPGFYRG